MRKAASRSIAITLGLLATLSLPAFSADRPPADYTDPVTGMEFMAIQGGTFMMGNSGDDFAKPVHEVKVKPFLLGRFEVTFEQYAKFCSSNGRLIPSDSGWGMSERPVINVSWMDAIDFTKWLSEKTGKIFRLPSEAEWEYAARGGTTTKFPWGDEKGRNQANCRDCGSQWDNRMTSPTGSFSPNGYGLYDMTGNVYEWCQDIQHSNYRGAPLDASPWLTDGKAGERVDRGGSWYRPASEMDVSARCSDKAELRNNEIGFRVVMEED